MDAKITVSNAAKASKKQKYEELLPQIASLLEGESDLTAKMANTVAVLKQNFDFLWVGFYVVKGRDLVLAPFQGALACFRIPFGKGVCGAAWRQKETLIVADVSKFAGHIVCDSASKSEIVVPLISKADEVIGVLDIDSGVLNHFDQTDAGYLKKITALL
ncbi:MAG: GAF domain-containing protein [Elusimicrobiota bacterium]|jgi:GAF domain-containing protein|nr:GAF domain-containing protein [Elusimicrobiota bacterium]